MALGDWNVGLTFSRQYMSQVPLQNGIEGYRLARESGFDIGRIKEDLLSLNISIPLGRRQTNMLSTGYSHSSQGSDNYSLGLSGIVSDDKAWTYGLNTTVQQFDETSKSLSLNTQKRFSQVAVSGSYSIADSYQQVSAGMTGAIVAHSGGMTLSQNLSDTFAIVEADGATGARVTNNWGTEIDNRGYAIIPSLTPYRSNRITLDTGNMRGSTELLNAQQQVIPYAGAIVKMKFDTRFGIPVLFITQLADGGVIPIGAEVTDENGLVLGMVGQAGIAYVRASKAEGKLIIQWGDENAEQCYFDYELELEVDLLQRLQVTCGQQS